jgi:hypothetical protein
MKAMLIEHDGKLTACWFLGITYDCDDGPSAVVRVEDGLVLRLVHPSRVKIYEVYS